MLRIASNVKFQVFVGVSLVSLALSALTAPLVHGVGLGAQNVTTMPVTIDALCSDQTSTAVWRIGNPNPDPVTVSWGQGQGDSATVPYGYTTVDTLFNSGDTTVTFQQNGQPDATMPISNQTCAAPIEGCVDGYARANLTYTWSQDGTVTLATKDGAPLCDDVTVYFSSYTLPSTYDESGVFDDSSIPQQLFSSTSTVLKQGTAGNVTLNIAVPNACTDYQLDVYYAPEITTVSYHGQGAQLIYGNIYMHTATSCTTTPPQGGRGGGQVLGATTTLANTGENPVLPEAAAMGLMIAATFIKFPIFGQAKRLFVR